MEGHHFLRQMDGKHLWALFQAERHAGHLADRKRPASCPLAGADQPSRQVDRQRPARSRGPYAKPPARVRAFARRQRRVGGWVGAAIVASTVLTACSTSVAPPLPAARRGAPQLAPARAGTADVAFAGSLLAVDDEVVGPAFERAEGYHYTGRGGGSIGLAHEIEAGEITPGVFESIGAAPVSILEPTFTRWYVQFAASPLVLAYNPHSADAAVFRAAAKGTGSLASVFEAMAAPGFHLGRTNPATDPQGQAFIMMVELAQRVLHLPKDTVTAILGSGATTGSGGRSSQIFAETALDSRLQSGQLDAASAFRSQAVQLHLPYVTLPASIDFGDPADAADYERASLVVPSTSGQPTTVHGSPLVIDITTVHEASATAADVAAADAFVAYQLSSAGRRDYAREGFTLLRETVYGARSSVPPVVRRVVDDAG